MSVTGTEFIEAESSMHLCWVGRSSKIIARDCEFPAEGLFVEELVRPLDLRSRCAIHSESEC